MSSCLSKLLVRLQAERCLELWIYMLGKDSTINCECHIGYYLQHFFRYMYVSNVLERSFSSSSLKIFVAHYFAVWFKIWLYPDCGFRMDTAFTTKEQYTVLKMTIYWKSSPDPVSFSPWFYTKLLAGLHFYFFYLFFKIISKYYWLYTIIHINSIRGHGNIWT